MSDLTEMARQVAGKVALIQVVELTALAMEGPELTASAARRMSDRVAMAGAEIIVTMVKTVMAELEAENQRLRATIDTLCDKMTDEAPEFIPIAIPEATTMDTKG